MINFGYDIDVSLEEINSPLPPRKVPFDTGVETEPEGLAPTQPTPSPRVNVVGPNVTSTTTPVESKPTKKKVKKILIFVIIAVVLLLIAGGVFALLKKPEKQVTLNYWGLWEEESVMQGIIADFESKNPNIKINYKKNQKDGYRGRLGGRLAKAGEVEDVPDIFRIHNTWIPMFRDNLAIVPKETVANLAIDTDFFDIYKTDLKEDGEYLSIPLMYDGLVMFYNPELLNKAQVTVPNNWWDLKKSAVKITEKDANGKIKVAGVALGLTDNVDHWSDVVGVMMKQNGVRLNTLSAENSKKMKDVLDFYTLFKTSDKVWDESLPNSTQYFASGNLAFYFGPSWRVFDIQTLNPNLKFEMAPLPQLPTTESVPTDQIGAGAELTNIHWGSYWTEGVSNKSKYQKEAWKFLEYLASAESLEKVYKADSQTRAFGMIYPRKSMAEKISANSKIKPLVDTANFATSWYLASETGDDGLNTEMQKYFGDAINSIALKNINSQEAVATLLTGVAQLQQKYKLIR